MATEGAHDAIGQERLEPWFELLANKDRELREKRGADLRALRGMTWGAILIGVAALALYGAPFGSRVFVQVLALGLLASGAAALAGTLIGVLFGVPQPSAAVAPATQDAAFSNGVAGSARTSAELSRSGTNLEQMSDWLTKVLIGAALTQAHRLPDALGRLAAWLGSGLPAEPQAGKFVLGAVVYCFVLGVLFGYVWTRVVLSPMLRRTDEQLRHALARVGAAEQSATRVFAELAVAERASAVTLEGAQASAESLVLEAGRRLEKLESVQQRMLERLYAPPDRRGYDEAIRLADEYVAEHGEPDSFLFRLRYATAAGQRASHDPERYDEARGAALEAAKKVVQKSPELGRYWLSLLWHPEHPEGTPAENDLTIFFDDPEFKALIGKDPFVLPK